MLATHLSVTRSHWWMTRFHLGIASTHLSVPRHLLIHRMRLASLTSGSSHFAGVHCRLVSVHVCSVALIFGLQLVAVCSGVTCSRARPIMFSHVSAVVFSFSRSGSGICFLNVTVSYVARFVSSFSCSCCCSLGLTVG